MPLNPLQKFVKQLSWVDWVVVAAIIVGAVLRLWNFRSTLEFQGDQGRDAIIVSRIFRQHDPVLIGPMTSTGDMYLGPLYYYFMTPFLMMTYPSPTGPAYAVAGLSILTIALIYLLGRELVGNKAAALAAVAFSVTDMAILYGRFSWNPNPAPLVGIILIWALWQARRKNVWYWVLVSACISILMQLHYVSLVMVPVAGIWWLLSIRDHLQAEKSLQKLWLATVVSIGVFIAFLSPLIAFDFRHNWLNLRSLQAFIANSEKPLHQVSLLEKVMTILSTAFIQTQHLFIDLFMGAQGMVGGIALGIFSGIAAFQFYQKRQYHQSVAPQTQLLLLSTVLTIIGLAFYRGEVHDHYLGFFLPISLLILAKLLYNLRTSETGRVFVGGVMILFIGWNLTHLPLKSLGWTIDDMNRTAQTIADRVKPGEKYNIVLLSESKDLYGQNYRYFLTTTAQPPVTTDEFADAQTLFVIDEEKKMLDITNRDIYEINVFPNKTPFEVYTVQGGPRITVLRATAAPK